MIYNAIKNKIESYFDRKIKEYDYLANERSYDLETKLYHLLVFDKEVINFIKKYGAKSLTDSLEDFYYNFDNLIHYLNNYYLDSNDYWHFFGKKSHDLDTVKNKFDVNRLKLKDTDLVFNDVKVGFKYYIKPSLNDIVSKPEKVIQFYKELIDDVYDTEVYQFKIPRKFQEFVLRRDGFVFYLNKDMVDDFIAKVAKKMKKFNLDLRTELGFDIVTKDGTLSYSQLKVKKMLSQKNGSNDWVFDAYSIYEKLKNAYG